MKKSVRKIAIMLSAFMLFQPAVFAVDTQLNKDIMALELEIVKIKTKSGKYSDMDDEEIEKELSKAQNKLEKKKAKAQKESDRDKKKLKEETEKIGEDLKDAGTQAGKDLKKAGQDLSNKLKNLFSDD